MKKLFIIAKDKALSSYWFYPATLFVLSITAAYGTIELDYRYGEETRAFMKNFIFFNDLSMSTARTYLSTLAGAVITVAGVVFSLTILTVSSASNQFGPRILNNFMRDRGKQLTLGVFTSTFVYCSTVLLSLYEKQGEAFIPYLSLFVSYALALLSVGFLIYYIHHIPESLRIETIMGRIALKAQKMIDNKFPFSEGVSAAAASASFFGKEGEKAFMQSFTRPCGNNKIGYVQAVDLELLIKRAKNSNAVFWLSARPGDFLNGEQPFFVSDRPLGEKEKKAALEAFAVGEGRTLPQNLMYLLSQLMEVAIRGMSPGMNDPITAMSCMDWLEACLIKMLKNDARRVFVLDDEKNPRLVMEPVTVEEAMFHMRKGLAQHMSANYATAIHMMESLERIQRHAGESSQREAIKGCGAELLAFCKKGSLPQGQMQRLAETFSSFSSNHLNYPHGYH